MNYGDRATKGPDGVPVKREITRPGTYQAHVAWARCYDSDGNECDPDDAARVSLGFMCKDDARGERGMVFGTFFFFDRQGDTNSETIDMFGAVFGEKEINEAKDHCGVDVEVDVREDKRDPDKLRAARFRPKGAKKPAPASSASSAIPDEELPF